jgi:hypothetical protein
VRKYISCECGKLITPNTWTVHLKGSKCKVPLERKEFLMKILSLKTKHRYAWSIKLGLNATSNSKWFYSIIEGTSNLEDWTFSSPRKVGSLPPCVLKRFSQERSGINNPMVRSNIKNYNIEDIKEFAKLTFKHIQDHDDCFRKIISILESEYPMFKYEFSDLKISNKKTRGFNKENYILSLLLDIDVDEIIKISHKMRGKSISKGQNASEKFKRSASEHAASLTSSIRISKPQIILYNMIKSVDPEAILEKIIYNNGFYKAYDIYSPAINALIEMHGRVFHDPTKATGKLIPIAEKNFKNDELKKSIAKHNNMKYIVFWDDEFNSWQETIKILYNLESISYVEAKNKVY